LILLVDDEAPIRITASHVRKAAGYNVITANDGVEALQQYREHGDAIRAIVLDMMMPTMDGSRTT